MNKAGSEFDLHPIELFRAYSTTDSVSGLNEQMGDIMFGEGFRSTDTTDTGTDDDDLIAVILHEFSSFPKCFFNYNLYYLNFQLILA